MEILIVESDLFQDKIEKPLLFLVEFFRDSRISPFALFDLFWPPEMQETVGLKRELSITSLKSLKTKSFLQIFGF